MDVTDINFAIRFIIEPTGNAMNTRLQWNLQIKHTLGTQPLSLSRGQNCINAMVKGPGGVSFVEGSSFFSEGPLSEVPLYSYHEEIMALNWQWGGGGNWTCSPTPVLHLVSTWMVHMRHSKASSSRSGGSFRCFTSKQGRVQCMWPIKTEKE